MDNQNDGKRNGEAPEPVEAGAEASVQSHSPEDPSRPAEDLTHYAAPEIDDDDDDAPTEWVPSRFEKRVNAIPEGMWNLYQTLAGVAVGLFTVFALFQSSEGLGPMFLVALVLALAAPNLLEDRGRRKLNRFRIVLVIVLAAGIIAMTVYTGTTQGWDFLKKPKAESAMGWPAGRQRW